MLYCKLRCNVISLATPAQWHRERKKVWRQEVAIFGQTATYFGKERLWVLRGPICPQIFPKWKIISAKTARNQPKLRECCGPWQKLCGCAKTRKLSKSCAPQHRNFLVGLTVYEILVSTHYGFKPVINTEISCQLKTFLFTLHQHVCDEQVNNVIHTYTEQQCSCIRRASQRTLCTDCEG